jgi:hypothetical protein
MQGIQKNRNPFPSKKVEIALISRINEDRITESGHFEKDYTITHPSITLCRLSGSGIVSP